MPRNDGTPPDLDEMLAKASVRPDRCRVMTLLTPEHREWLDRKVAEARERDAVPPWSALCKVLKQLGYEGFYSNLLIPHYARHGR